MEVWDTFYKLQLQIQKFQNLTFIIKYAFMKFDKRDKKKNWCKS